MKLRMCLLMLICCSASLRAIEEGAGAPMPLPYEPASYPDEAGFDKRRMAVIDALADMDLSTWERGSFDVEKGKGDPAKYAVPVMIAKLAKNPGDREPWEYMKRGKHATEITPHALANMARLFHLFRDAMPRELRERYVKALGRGDGADSIVGDWQNKHLGGGGTENQMAMLRTSGYVFASLLPDGVIGGRSNATTQRITRDILRRYIKNLYTLGNGEWESGAYTQFTINGFLNIYDTTKDEQMKTLARAALDWFVAVYGQKYFNGTLCGAEKRGFSAGALQNITDCGFWVWFGSSTLREPEKWHESRHAIHACTSTYRPNKILYNLACKRDLKMPFEIRSSKPDDHMTKPNQDQEYAWATPSYVLGSLYASASGIKPGDNQLTTWKLVARGPGGSHVFGGSQPWHGGPLGRSPYDQLLQSKGALISMSRIEDGPKPREGGDKVAETRFYIPFGVKEIVENDGFIFIDAHDTLVALHPLGESYKLIVPPPDEKGKASPWNKLVIIPGKKAGFVLEAAQSSAYANFAAFQKTVLNETRLDTSRFKIDMYVRYHSLSGDVLDMEHSEKGMKAISRINARTVDYSTWPVQESPYVRQETNSGVLKVFDGVDGFQIDFSGEWPVYSPCKP